MALHPEMVAYVNGMPQIFKHIFVAFHDADRHRRRGDCATMGTLLACINSTMLPEGSRYSSSQVTAACAKLSEYRFLKGTQSNKSFLACPTELGEDVIEHLTGHRAPEATIPDLGPPPGFRA